MAVYTPPPSIDRTGATDVGVALSKFLNGEMVVKGDKWVATGAPGPYSAFTGGFAGVPDGSTVLFPAGAKYRINDYCVVLNADLIAGGPIIENGRLNRSNIILDWNGSWLFRTITQLSAAGPTGESPIYHMLLLDHVDHITVKNLGVRGPKAQAMNYTDSPVSSSAQYYETMGGAIQGLAVKYCTFTNNVVMHAMVDPFNIRNTDPDYQLDISTALGSSDVFVSTPAAIATFEAGGGGKLSGAAARPFDASLEGRPITTASLGTARAATDWEQENHPGWYGGSTVTPFPYNPKADVWADWPKLHIIDANHAKVFRGNTWATGTPLAAAVTRPAQFIHVGWSNALIAGACYGNVFQNNYVWDCGRSAFVCQRSYPDPVFGVDCLIEGNQAYYVGYVGIDSIGDFANKYGFGNIVTTGTGNPEIVGAVKPINQLEGLGNVAGKLTTARPPTSSVNPVTSPRVAGMPSYAAFPMQSSYLPVQFTRAPALTAGTVGDTSALMDYRLSKGVGAPHPAGWASNVKLEVSQARTGGSPNLLAHDASYRVFYGGPSPFDPDAREGIIAITGLASATPGSIYYYQVTVVDEQGGSDTTAPGGNIARSFQLAAGTAGPPPTDIAPTVSAITTDQIADTTARVNFFTNHSGDAVVVCVPTGGGVSITTRQGQVNGTHHVLVAGLIPGEQYTPLIYSESPQGRTTAGGGLPNASGAPFTTTTTGVDPGFAITLNVIDFPSVTPFSFRLAYITTLPGSTLVTVTPTNPPGAPFTFVDDPTLTQNHVVTVDGLDPETTYVPFVSSTSLDGTVYPDPGGFPALLSPGPVTTLALGETPFAVTNLRVTGIGQTVATVEFDSTQPGTSQAAFGTGGQLDTVTVLVPSLALHHAVHLTGLTPGAIYAANGMSSTSPSGTPFETFSSPVTFATLPSGAPPPTRIGRLARAVSVQHGRIATGERDVTVHERSDRRDGSRGLIEYLHSSLVDTGTPSRDPFFMAVEGTHAVVDVALDYALSTLRWSVLSSDWDGGAIGSFHADGWGNDLSTDKMELGRIFGGTRPDGQGRGGMGAKADRILLVGYSHGGPLAMNYVRRFPGRVAGVLLFHPAVNLDYLRGTDASHPGGSGAFPSVTVNPGGFYGDLNGSYLNDPHNPSPGSTVTDARWAAIRAVHDPSLFDWSTIPSRPPVLDFVSNDDYTLGPIVGNQDLFPAAYGSLCTMVTLPDLAPVAAKNGHFSGGFRAEPYATQIRQFIDSLTF